MGGPLTMSPPTTSIHTEESHLPVKSLSVMYADDDTDHSQDKNPDKFIEKIQYEANCSSKWVADNKLVCSGCKTKLLIITTTVYERFLEQDQVLKEPP